MEAGAILAQWRSQKRAEEPHWSQRALEELSWQIRSQKYYCLNYSAMEGELRSIRAWIWRAWKWKGVFFGWQKYKWKRAGGLLGWGDKWESGLLEGPAALGACAVILVNRSGCWITSRNALYPEYHCQSVLVSVLCLNRSLQPLLLSCQSFKGFCLCQAYSQWHEGGKLLFKWYVSPQIKNPATDQKKIKQTRLSWWNLNEQSFIFLVALQNRRHWAGQSLVLGRVGGPDWDRLKAGGHCRLSRMICPINSSQNENNSLKIFRQTLLKHSLEFPLF